MYRSLSQIAHVELLSPNAEESIQFFKEQLGMVETARDGRSVYLRTWGDFFHHTMVVTAGPAPAVAHVGWRAASAEALQLCAERLEAGGHGEGWVEDTPGHGPAYRYRSPGGHLHEVFWEVERFKPPPELRSTFPARPQRPASVASAVRQLDHVTLGTARMAEDVAFFREVLGYRFMEYTVMDSAAELPFFAQLSNTEQAHDIALIADDSGIGARSHHIALWVDQTADVIRAADAIIEAGVQIEWGPGRHGHGENTFVYFREPGGHRLEIFSGGYRNYQPDWEPVRWVATDGGADMFRNYPAPEAMLEMFPNQDIAAEIVSGATNPWALPSVS